MKDNARPLVSVVIPTYNHAHFLDRALQSVLDQTYTNWEAIIIDNHSIDNTDEVVHRFIDPRITLLKINNNGVIGASRNMGIRAAKGDWIAFLDSDDWWMPNKLQVCQSHIRDDIDVVYHDLKIVRDQRKFFGHKKIKSRQLKKTVLADLLISGNLIPNSSVLVRRRLLNRVGGIDEDVKMIASEDYNTWLRIAEVTDAFLYVSQCLGYYMDHSQGISRRDMSLSYSCAVANFVDHLNEIQRNSLRNTILYMSGRYHYLNNEYIKANDELKCCLKNANGRIRLRAIFMLTRIYFAKIFLSKS
ncbi:MAG: glycosyltransferase [Cellvibrio sp.]|uniref:glycosyltransferase family 2 protein n=1 Tax=Cellvibrio sp. TaxID=1965322 RepID=UPI00271A74FE|nr:glycosyltransferase [Cellvibrio sp.]